MEKQLTPIQELIERWKSDMNDVPSEHDNLKGIYSLFIKEAELQLEVEKKAIIDFSYKLVERQVDGCGCYKNGSMEDEAEKLFKKTFETN